MKPPVLIMLLSVVLGLVLVYIFSDPDTRDKTEEVEQTIKPVYELMVINKAIDLEVYTVKIDGVEYIVASRFNGGVSIIPKVNQQLPELEAPTGIPKVSP
jgi:hypothetical protein